MAKTAFTTSDALTKKLFDERLFRDSVKNSYFAKFEGESSDNLVHVKTNLQKSKGDVITFGIRMRLTSAGVTSGQILEGNEDKLTTFSSTVSLEEYANAVRDRGPLDRQRAMFSIDEESKMALQDWGSEKIDSLRFTVVLSSPTKIFYKTSAGVLSTGTAATAKSALTAADSKLTPTMISTIRTWGATGGARTYVPIRPVNVEGRKYTVLLTHPDSLFDLKQDSTMTQALREAEVRGPSNPLFQGATLIWDNVVIHEHENCTTGADGGSGAVAWNKAVYLGAQALVWAWGGENGGRPSTVSETFDYGREHGFAWKIMAATAKPVFNSLDYGSAGIYLARTNISGI